MQSGKYLHSFTRAEFFYFLWWHYFRAPIGGIIDSNDAVGFYYVCYVFKIASNIACDISSAKDLTLSNSGIFRFLTRFEGTAFKSFAYLAYCVNILSPATSVIFSEDFFDQKIDLTVFKNCFIIRNISLDIISTYLLTNFSKIKLRKLLNFCQGIIFINIFEKN